MKKIISSLICIGCASTLSLNAQVYSITTPVNSSISLDVYTERPNSYSDGPGNVLPNIFSSVTDTVVINLQAGTVRHFGSFAVNPAFNTSFAFRATNTIPPVFPNTQSTTIVGDIDVQFLGASSFTFDTGLVTPTWDQATGRYHLGSLPAISFSVSWGYTLTTGGETYTGTFQQPFYQSPPEHSFFAPSSLSTTDYPSSIDLLGQWSGRLSAGGGVSFTANNGFKMMLSTGFQGFDGPQQSILVTPVSPLTLTMVPEPTALSLIGCGALIAWRRIASHRQRAA